MQIVQADPHEALDNQQGLKAEGLENDVARVNLLTKYNKTPSPKAKRWQNLARPVAEDGDMSLRVLPGLSSPDHGVPDKLGT